MGAPSPIDIIDVIAIPRLTLLFGGRLLYTRENVRKRQEQGGRFRVGRH
jgi:hypothetical protein